MKRDKAWLINELLDVKVDGYDSYYNGDYEDGLAYALQLVRQLVRQLDEPEKIVIPQFVADWWDGDSVTMYGGERINKKYKLRLISEFHDRGLGDYLSKVEDWLDENDSTFLGLVNGKPYEVEKEKLYIVGLINNHYRITHCLAYDLVDNVFFISQTQEETLNKFKKRFTEKEIKNYDERYWAFAVVVTE